MAAETTFTVKIAVQQDGSISLIDQAGQKIASLGQAADAAKGGLGALEQGTQAVGSAAQSAGTQMGDAGNKAGELGSKAASSSSGISSMASTLLSLDAAVRLANVAFDIGKAAFDAFFMNIVDRAGSLDDLSQKIGVAGTTLSQFSLAAQATGTSVEGLGTGFKMLSVNLTEAANGGNESAAAMKSAFQTLGVDVTAALSDTNSALLTISDTFAAMPDGAEKTALAMQLFGKAGVEMIPFLNQGSEGIAKMTELNDKLGLSFSGETLSALDNFGDQLTVLGNVGTGVFTQLVSGAAPVLSQMADALVDMAAKAGINSGTLQEWGRTIAETVVNAVATALGAIGQFLVDIESAGIGSALYNAFAAAFESVKAVAASAMASVKASIYDALSVLPLIGSSYAEAAANMRASAASYLEGVTAIGQGSTAIGNAGRALLDTSSALKGVSSSASEAGGAIMSAADGADQMSSGMSSVASGAELGHQALQKLTASGTTAGGAVKGAGDAAGAAGAAAGGAAGGVDKLSQAMDKLAQQSTQIATKQGIYDAYIEGAINYEQALIALDTAQIGGEEATQNLTVAMQAEAVAREQAAMALTQQTAEQMNKNAITEVEIAALQAAAAAGQTYEQAQLAASAASLQYQANEKVAAGATAESAAAWAEGKIAAEQYTKAKQDAAQASKNNDSIRMLQLELDLTKQVAAGVITQTQAERQMAIAAAGTNVKLQEQAGQIFDLTKSIEDAKDSYVHIGDILKGAFDQAFDAVIAGTRDLGDALEGIALSIGKQIFSNMLDAKFKDFDPTMKKNFLDLGEFGKGIFGDVFSGAADQAAQNPIGQNEDGSFIYGPGGGSSSSGGGGMAQFFGNFMAGMGMGAFGKGVTDSFRGGPSSTGSKGWDTALGFQNMVSTGLAQALGGPLAALLVGVFNSFLPDIVKTIRDAFDTTTKGTKQREKGEDYLGSSPTFSALQDKSKLGDFTRDENKRLGLFDNYRTGVATAIERGMKEGEANALKGAGQGIFSVIFKNDGDAMVNGAMDMGRSMAELLSRGLADGMTYDEMLGSLRSFAKENDISFKNALIGVNNFGKAAIEQFDKVGHADWGAQEFADGIYGISEIFKNDFPQGVNLASIALQTMEKDGSKAFQNLDAGTKQWILSVANDAEAFKTVFASLAQQGFTIDTAEFEATLADITASAELVGANIGTLLSAPTLAQGMQGLGEALKTEIKGALGENMLGDLFDTTGIATAFQDLFANINDLKSGEMSSGDFMSGMAEAIASGKANLEEYLPRIKAMRDAMAEVEAAVDEAFKPTAAEELAAATEAMAAGLKDSFGGGIAAAMDAALAEGGDRAAGIAAFGESMRGSIKDSVKNSIIQGMVEAAMMQGPLAEMMATFGQAFKAAVQGGITSEEQAMLNAYLGQMGTVADQTIAYLQPSVDAVLQLGEAADSTFGKLNGGTVGVPNDPALAQFKKDVAEAQTTLKTGFSSAVSEAFSMIGQGKSVEEATAAFSESFKTSISSSVAQGLQEALVQSAVMEGALGTMMAQFKEATAAAMADGVITGAEQANLAAMAQQIKTTGEAAANALAPVVASVATIATGVASGTDSVSFNVNTNAEASAAAADSAIATSATTATTTVASATTSAAATVSGAVTEASGAYQELVTASAGAATEIAGGAGEAGSKVAGALAEAGEKLSSGATVAAEQAKELAASGAGELSAALGELSASASEVTGAGSTVNEAFQQASAALSGAAAEAAGSSSATLTAAYSDAASKAAQALEAGGMTMSTDMAAATESLKASLGSILGTGDEISAMAPDAAYGIGQSLAAVRDQVAPEMQTQIDALIGSLGDASLSPEETERVQQMMASLGGLGTAMTPEQAAQANAVIAAVGDIGGAITPDIAAQTAAALGSVGEIGTALPPDLAAAAAEALGSVGMIGEAIPPDLAAKAAEALGSFGAIGDLPPDLASKTAEAFSAFGTIGDSLPPDLAAQAAAALSSVGTLGQALTPDMAAQANAVISAVGTIGDGIDPATIASTQQALSSLATIGTDVDPSGVAQFSAVTAALADGASAIGDPGAVVDTMKALGEAALSSGDAANLAGTMQALGAAALDSGTAANMGATLQAFANASAEGANNTTAVIDAFSGIDAGSSAQIKQSLEQLVSTGVVDGAAALSTSLGGDAPDAIVAGLQTLQSQLDAGELSSLTDPLNEALGSMVNPADSVKSALDRLMDPTRNVTDQMGTLENATRNVINAFNSASSSLNARGGTPAAATGGSFAGGSAVVGEAGRPELVSSRRGGGFNVTPLTWPQAKHLMRSGTPGMAVGGVVGGGQFGGGGGTVPPAPTGGGGGGGGYTPNAEGAEFADFTSAIVEAFRAGFEGSKSFIEDFSDSINESVRTRLVDAIMQGFAESPAIQKYADNIDTLITKAQSLAGNNKLTAEELANIQSQIKENTDAIGEQADVIDELLEPMRQAEAISTAISDGLDFSSALKNLALNPNDLEGFRKSIDQTVNDAVLNGAIQGLLASGPIQDAVKKFGDSMNDAMATALEDGVITAEESSALHDLAVSGSAEMKTAMEALGPVLSALGIDLGDAMTEGINRAKDVMKAASSEMDPFAALGEGETQFGNFTQSIRDQVYGNIRDGMVQAFIDSAVTQGLLAGPMMAIQSIFDEIGQKQLTTAQANAALAEQVAAINGSLNDPAFKTAFDTTMASINQIGQSLGQTSKRVESSAITAASSAQTVTNASKDVCAGKCKLEKDTQQLGFAAVNTFGRSASVSVEQMIPKMALGGLVTKPTFALVGEAGPELVIPARALDTRTNIQRLADIAASSTAASGGPAPVAVDMSRMIQGSDNTVTAIKDLHDRLDKLSDAILAQPTEVSVQMDRETLMRAMAKADRLKKKARYGATA